MNNPLKALNVSDLEMNVLQVSVDHMVEHLEDLCADDTNAKISLEAFEERGVNLTRLDAAKRLRRLFAYQPTSPLEAVKQVKEAMK